MLLPVLHLGWDWRAADGTWRAGATIHSVVQIVEYVIGKLEVRPCVACAAVLGVCPWPCVLLG